MTSIKVAIKVRPLIQRELQDKLSVQWEVKDNTIYPIDQEVQKRNDNAFQFDHVFDMESTNLKVFNTVVKPIIEAAVNGFNGTIFAYGQTSSGKTFTMMGNEDHPGIITLTIDQIFNAIENANGREFLLRVAYIEIYNERVHDLLEKNNEDLRIREDNGEVFIKCKEEVILSAENILAVMRRGDKHRRIGQTDMNLHSSRSHSIFRIIIESKESCSDSDGAVQVSQLNLVDLAGSERATATSATDDRFREGRHINLSLSALGKVIMELSDNKEFVNFRDSKLTRILQASLGGNAMTAIICAVTPASFEETLNTLNFASRAKSIKNKPKLNEVMSDSALLKRYRKQIEFLSQKLQNIDDKTPSDEVKEMANKLEEQEKMNQTLLERINLLQRNILSSNNEVSVQGVYRNSKHKSKRRQTWAAPGRHSLPTILESSPEKSVNLNLQQQYDDVPYSDFEIDLYNSILVENETVSDNITCPTVTFSDKDEINNTPNMSDSTSSSPGTPKEQLREKLRHAAVELETLREYNTLEKQLLAEDTETNLREEFVQLKHQIRNIRNENEIFQDSIRSKEKEIQTLSRKNEELEQRLKESNDLKDKLKSAEKNLLIVQSKCTEYEDMIAKMHKSTDTLLIHVSNENVELKKKLELAYRELITLKSSLEIKQTESKKNDLEKDEMREKLKMTEEQLDTFKSKVLESKEKIAQLETIKQELLENQNSNSAKIKIFESRIQTMEVENNCLVGKMNQLSKMRREKEEQITKCQNLEESVSCFETIVKKQEEEIKSLQQENNYLKEQFTSLSQNNDKLNSENFNKIICELKSEKDALNENLKRKENEYEQLKVHLQSLDEDYQNKIDLSNKAVESLEQNNALLKEKNKTIEKQVLEFDNKILTLEACKNELTEHVKMLEQQKANLQEDFIKKSKLLEESQQQCDELQNRIQVLESEIEIHKQQHHASNQERVHLKEALKTEETNFNNLTLKFKEQKNILNEMENELQQYQSIKESLTSQIADFEKQESQSKCDILENELQILKSEKCVFEEEKLKFNELKAQFEEQCYLNNQKLADLQESLNEEKVKCNELREWREEQQSYLKEMEYKLNEYKENKEALNSRMKIMTVENQEYKNKCEQLQQTIYDLDTKIEYLSKYKHLEVEIKELKDQQASLITKAAEEQHSLDIKELTNLQEVLNEEKRKCENFKVKLDEQECLLVTLNEKLAKNKKEFLERDEILTKLKTENNSMPKQDNAVIKIERFDSLEQMDSDVIKESKSLSKCVVENSSSTSSVHQKEDESIQKSLPSKFNFSSNFKNHSDVEKSEIIQDKTFSEFDSTMEISTLKNENKKLQFQLQAKIQELKEIQNDVQDLKNDICKLQQTVYNLNSENTELSENLNKEKKKFQEMESDFQAKNEELIEKLTEINSQYLRQENEQLHISLQNEVEEKQRQADLLKEYQNKVSIFEKEKQDFVAALEAKELIKNTLENQVMEKEKEINDLQKSIAQLRQLKESAVSDDINDLESRITNLSKENEELLSNENTLHEKTLEEQITNLSTENENDSKVCFCGKSKDEIENRRSLKAEVKSLNRQLKDLQKRYEQKVADTESLRTKAKESLDESLLNDSFNVSLIQEKVVQVDSEFDSLKNVHRLLSISFQDKCDEIEKLQKIISTSFSEETNSAEGKKKDKIDKLNKDLDTLRHDLKSISKNYESIKSVLNKFVENKTNIEQELESLKWENKGLLEQLMLAENETADLSTKILSLTDEINELHIREADLVNKNVWFENALSELSSENTSKENAVHILQKSLQEIKNEKISLTEDFETLRKEKEQLVALQNCMESTLHEYKCNIEELEIKFKEVSDLRSEQMKENDKLRNQLEDLRIQHQKYDLIKSEEMFSIKELEETRQCITKEIKSLDPNVNISMEKTTNDLFLQFLKTLMEKETEIINTLQEQITLAEQKLLDKKQEQSELEKKFNQLMKNSETDNEKLQTEITDKEKLNRELLTKIDQLEDSVKTIRIDNLSLKEQIRDLENETLTNQQELDRYRKLDISLNVIQEKERQVQEIIMEKEAALLKKLAIETDAYTQQINDLSTKIETLKLQNSEFLNSIETLKTNEKQLKNVIDANNNENTKLNNEIADLKKQLDETSATYTKLNSEIVEKDNRIETIALHLKQKCDKYSEYKTKLETLKPDYEALQEQVRVYRTSIDKYKTEAIISKENLTKANSDLLTLKKELEKECNQYTVLQTEHQLLKEKYADLEVKNTTLARKVRRSSSNMRVTETFEDLTDKNKTLEQNLEGVSNRIITLQKQNAEYAEEIKILRQKNEEYEKQINNIDNRNDNSSRKNCNSNNEIMNLQQEIDRLKGTNKELDEENVELATMISSLQHENGSLLLKVQEFEMATENEQSPEQLKVQLFRAESMVSDYEFQVKNLQSQLSAVETQNLLTNKNVNSLNQVNQELLNKIMTLEDKLESMSACSTRSNSPAFEVNLRRQRRSSQFNQNRNLESICECSSVCINDTNCACNTLRQQIRNLELQIVDKDCNISTLELQIRKESFSCKEKCKQLKDSLATYHSKVRRSNSNTSDSETFEDLTDKNKTLEQNLEGVSNRIITLQKQNAEYAEEIKILRHKNEEYEKQMNNIDNRNDNSSRKNCNSNNEIMNLQQEIDRLKGTNKELEEENVELATMVSSLQHENGSLLLKVQEFEMATVNEQSPEQLKDQLLSAESIENLRRQRRSSQFNQNRNLASICECSSVCINDTNCACNTLRQQIRNLELQIVDKDCNISTLELQIRSENFPYKEKCKQLKDSLATYQSKVNELQSRIRKSEQAAQVSSSRDCDICKKRLTNKKDQSIQFPERTICMTGVQSGIIKEDQQIQKLEKEKDILRDICRERRRKLIQAETKIKKYEETFGELPNDIE